MFRRKHELKSSSRCSYILLALCIQLLVTFLTVAADSAPGGDYIREWAAQVSDPVEADLIALETGFVNRGPIKPFHDIYLFEHASVPHRSKRHAVEHTERLNNHEKVGE